MPFPFQSQNALPDRLLQASKEDLACMVVCMAGLAALGGTHRQIEAPELSRRVHLPEHLCAVALENLVQAGLAKHHFVPTPVQACGAITEPLPATTSRLPSYRIFA